ncbi:DUF5694 domain-containing protein [Solibacillus sp. MA9]|uniref:DUF5694 domain-containing protein n=1 Tax=Solibacillus palustris TaxID=2908203 RepID=A0ABS9UC68_9BACL|nr:DUF5694 domain-containing protein [Solibacillus sp. MA9]MCH7321563.1 DUF5694 domain-containing protein [Solibacillus sp. MA9]
MEILLVGTIHLGYTPDMNTLSKNETDKYSDIHFEQLTNDIAKFQADQVFVEYPFGSQKHLNTIYRSNNVNERIKENEIYQIGFRLAKKIGHKAIYAVDWNEDPEELKDIGLVAEGKSKEEYQEIMGRIPIMIKKVSSIIQQGDIIKLYKYINSHEYIINDHKVYLDLMQLDDEIAFEWVSKYWYYRNLRIVQNIKKLLKPETKRAVILYGAGHNYLIKQQLEDDPSIKVFHYGDWVK